LTEHWDDPQGQALREKLAHNKLGAITKESLAEAAGFKPDGRRDSTSPAEQLAAAIDKPTTAPTAPAKELAARRTEPGTEPTGEQKALEAANRQLATDSKVRANDGYQVLAARILGSGDTPHEINANKSTDRRAVMALAHQLEKEHIARTGRAMLYTTDAIS